jgi:uncharacterized protein
MPRLLAETDRAAFCSRLARYVQQMDLKRCVVVFHGGEPLLAGFNSIAAFAGDLRAAVGPSVTLDIGLQTNGLLLTDAALDAFEAADIAVSLSLDGPREANDRHRTSAKGRSSFDRVNAALERLKARPKTFAGVIAVIDAAVPPETLFEFFAQHRLPKLDFLLPDAHHHHPPPGRAANPNLYKDWLIRAFDLWLDRYPDLPIRTFESLLDTLAGLRAGTDAFGLGDVSLITIETDGTYHDLDVFKVVGNGATRLTGSVQDTDIETVAASEAISKHRSLLQRVGLCATCQACPVVEICGGGSLPHRYGTDGFNQPTVYCAELLALITHAKEKLTQAINQGVPQGLTAPPVFDLAVFELAENSRDVIDVLWQESSTAQQINFLEAVDIAVAGDPTLVSISQEIKALSASNFARLANRPGTIAWQHTVRNRASGRSVHTVDGHPLRADGAYLTKALDRVMEDSSWEIGVDDEWLRKPFGAAIVFEPGEVTERAGPLIDEALKIVQAWRPALAAELRLICHGVQFVRDPAAHPEKIVSFSDNTVPGALYVSVVQGDGYIDAYDLADSLIHEYRHQKLYLFERLYPTVTPVDARVVSPWREDLRPPSGLVHAVFVFVELQRFWKHVHDHGPARLHNRAVNQIADTDKNLNAAYATLERCSLTQAGRELITVLKRASRPGLVVPG